MFWTGFFCGAAAVVVVVVGVLLWMNRATKKAG